MQPQCHFHILVTSSDAQSKIVFSQLSQKYLFLIGRFEQEFIHIRSIAFLLLCFFPLISFKNWVNFPIQNLSHSVCLLASFWSHLTCISIPCFSVYKHWLNFVQVPLLGKISIVGWHVCFQLGGISVCLSSSNNADSNQCVDPLMSLPESVISALPDDFLILSFLPDLLAGVL